MDDPDFLTFINKVENENIVKSFVSHKDGVDLSNISDDLVDKLIDDIDDISGVAGDKARYWNKRSAQIASNNNKFQKARQFETANTTKVASNTNPPCGAWGGNGNKYHLPQLHVRANGSRKRVVLDDALVDPSTYTDPITFISYKKLDYHDSKLTNTSPWSNNQRDDIIKVFRDNPSQEYIQFEVRSSATYFQEFTNPPLQTGDIVRIYREDVYKSISNGDGGAIIETIRMNDIGFQY